MLCRNYTSNIIFVKGIFQYRVCRILTEICLMSGLLWHVSILKEPHSQVKQRLTINRTAHRALKCLTSPVNALQTVRK